MKKVLTTIIFIISSIFILSFFRSPIYGEGNNDDWVIDLSKFRENTYYRKLVSWIEEVKYDGDEIAFFAQDEFSDAVGYYSNLKSIYLEKGETITFYLNAEISGLYQFGLNFHVLDDYTTAPTIELSVNEEVLYNELSNLKLPVLWQLKERAEKDKYNRYGNELLPYTVFKKGEYDQIIYDPEARFFEPLYLKLKEGENKITIKANNLPFYFKAFKLIGWEDLMSYQQYLLQYQKEEKVQNELIDINTYMIDEKSDIEIKASYYKGAEVNKASYKYDVLNVLSGSSISRTGSLVNYYFEVNESGLYNLSFKYLQDELIGMSSALNIFIDDEIPFKELKGYLFAYHKKWENETLNKDGNPFLIYLEEGIHKITIQTTLAPVMPIIDQLYQIMDKINSLGLAVSQITGRSVDRLIDWDLLKYLPNIKEELLSLAEQLNSLYDEINNLTPTSKRAVRAETIKIASKQLVRLAKYPNRIPNKLEELNKGSGSAYQLIGLAINEISNQKVTFEKIYFHSEDLKLPKANKNIFARFWFQFKSFFYSFFDQRYKLAISSDKETLNVWVGQSNLYLDIMQNLIDDKFTEETGIKVLLNVLPNTQKIVLNNATKTNPDVVLSIDSWNPYAYALRGMLSDLSQFEGFDKMTEGVMANNFTPMIYEDGVYGFPETQSTYLLYYRKDILEFLGIEPPDTWEDIINILPILQSYQMNFFHPLGGDGAYKGFGLTSPFIYQFGGEIYKENGFSTTFDEEINIEAITFMTNIFNVYNLPEQVPSFFEHFRSGSLPVGIDTTGFYLQLKYAAPELNGQWGILPLPGMFNNDKGEVVRWAPTYGKASILFKSSLKQREGFELIRWWNKVETQKMYLENIKTILGERYLILPANLITLEDSIWDNELKEMALIQAKWARIPAVTPGSYIVERELTNIWNKIVIDHLNPREAIDESIPRINRELRRKFEEFGYLKGGEVVREYKVPRNENIQHWIP